MPGPEDAPALVLISVGNTRTRFAVARGKELEPSRVVPNDRVGEIVGAVTESCDGRGASPGVVFASVNDPVADAIEAEFRRADMEPVRFGRDFPVPIVNAVDQPGTVGTDRLLDALGAYARSRQACVVIDAGTAVTVDFVDGEGTFQGGAIAPGLQMMLRAMHEQTAALPLVTLTPELLLPSAERQEEEAPAPDVRSAATPFGRTTAQAMSIGVVEAVRGLVHRLIDRYAEYYGGYPRIVATGGDAPLLFRGDDLVEHIVPDLTLIGMLEAVGLIEHLDNPGADAGPAG